LALFVLIALLYVASEPLRPYPLHYLVKAIPIFVLAVFAHAHLGGRMRTTVLLALMFSAGGDMMLSMSFTHQFIAGLGSFLVAQLIYGYLFLQLANKDKRALKILISAAAVLYAAVMAGLILPEEPFLKTAVLSYLVVITLMALAATWAWRRSPLHMLGAFVFVLSDSLIAWNMFASPVPFSSLLIMSTYYAAQCMMIKGIVNLQRETAA